MTLLTQTMQIMHTPKQSNRPYVNVRVKGKNFRGLYDTGADASCMSEDAFRSIPVDQRPVKKPDAIQRKFRAANGQDLQVRGLYDMTVTIQGKQVQHPFYVINNLSEAVILGMDFIKQRQFSFCPVQHEFYWTDQGPWTTGRMRTTKIERIEALSAQVIKVNLVTERGGRPEPGELSYGCVQVDQRPSLMGGPGLLKHNAHGQAWIEVINSSPFEVEISDKTEVGVFEKLSMEQVQMLDPVLVNTIAESKVKTSAPQAPSGEKRKFIIENLNLNVPADEKNDYVELIMAHHDVFSDNKYDLGRATTLMHDIELKDKNPVYVKQFKIPEAHQAEVEKHVLEWLKLGVIQPSRSKFNSPLFIVAKKDGGVRIVQDFRALNAQSVIDKYSMKDISECIGDIGKAGSTIFTTIDLTSGFWQMILKPNCRPYTAFTVPGIGQFEWVTSPMGLLGCPASFQRLVEAVVHGIRNIIVYIDDLLVHSKTHVEHRQQLTELFIRLRAHGLKANLKKCVFGSKDVAYLGFRLTPEGIRPGVDKAKVIERAQPPKNVHEVRQFLGLCNFFRSHVRNFAQVSAPLTALTRKDNPWKSGPLPPDALQSFQELKSCLTSGPIVDYPRANRPFALMVDAALGDDQNPGGLGAILTQINEKKEHCVIAYASRKLSAHEKNYTPFLLEMQACVWGIDHFSNYLRGRHFSLYTDHKPLTSLGKVHTRTLNRLQEIMNQYDFEIIYKKGVEMPADYLSRHAIDSVSWDTTHIIEQQKADPFLSALRKFVLNQELPTGTREQALIKFLGTDCFLENDVLWRRLKRQNEPSRVVLMTPRTLIPQVIKEAHGQLLTGHDGVFKTRERILLCYYWPNMDSDIKEHLNACEKCQLRKTHHAEPPLLLTPLPQTSEPNQRVHADLFGPLKTSGDGKKYILVMTDAFTKYVELVAIPNKEAATTASALFNRWFCRYGVPVEIVTDQGREFVNQLSEELFKLLGVLHTTTTPRHPQCNAQAEVANKTIAKYLNSFVNEATTDWELFLPPLMFSYNTSFHKSIQTTPFFLLHGVTPRLPAFPAPDLQRKFYGESDTAELHQRMLYARDLARRCNEVATDQMKVFHDAHSRSHDFKVGQWVLLDEHSFLHKNTKLAPKYSGPHYVLRVKPGNVVELKLKNGKHLIVNACRLKSYVFPLPDAQPEVPMETKEVPKTTPQPKLRKPRHPEAKIPLPEEDREEFLEERWSPWEPQRPAPDPVQIKMEPPDTPEPHPGPPEPPRAPPEVPRPRVGRPRAKRVFYEMVPDVPKPAEAPIPEDPSGARVTRSRARVLGQGNENMNAVYGSIQQVDNYIQVLEKRLRKINKWNKRKQLNYKLTGDTYLRPKEKNYVSCDPSFDLVGPVIPPPLVLPPIVPVVIPPALPAPVIDPVSSDSSDPSDVDSTDHSDPETEVEVEGAAGYQLADSDDSEVYFSPTPSSPVRTPRAPERARDLYPPAKFRAASLDFREYRGSIESARPSRSVARHPSPSPPDHHRKEHPVSKQPEKTGILGDFKDFVLGPQPSTSKGPARKPKGEPAPTERRTRAAGPATHPQGLPPSSRPTRGRGAKK